MGHPVALPATLSSIVLAWCACAFAMNPALAISQDRQGRSGFKPARLAGLKSTRILRGGSLYFPMLVVLLAVHVRALDPIKCVSHIATLLKKEKWVCKAVLSAH